MEKYLRVQPGGAAPHPQSWDQAAAVLTVCGRDEQQLTDRLVQAQDAVLECFG